MVVNYFDIVRVALAKFETNPPAVIHCHRPLPAPVAFEFVQADAFQRAQIAKRFSNIQGQQQIHGGFEIQSTKLVWPFAIPDLAGCRIPPRPDHGDNILRQTVNLKRFGERDAGRLSRRPQLSYTPQTWPLTPRTPPPRSPPDRRRI